jgi:thermitase
MKIPSRRIAAPLLVIATILCLLTAGTAGAEKAKKEFVAGELLVKFKQGYDGPGAKAIEKLGAKLIEKLSKIDVSRLKLPGGMTVAQAITKLEKLPFVEYAEPNLIFKPSWSPDDPHWNKQWGMTVIDVPAGWGKETGRRDTIIAIVDTGVDLDHPDLKNRIVAGYDFVDMDSHPDDVGGHGTHCAGIAAASANNGKGTAGVCPNCSIMPLRVLGPWGGSASDVAKGIIWAVDHGAQVISMSLGGAYPSSAQHDAMVYAWDKGAILIAAAGNQGTTSPHYPAYDETVLSVGSSDSNDTRSSFSTYGDWVDVAAPGSQIYSAVPDGGYSYKSGTSMACPHVAGLAGLLFSRAGATNQSVRKAIEDSCEPVGDWVIKGRVNVVKALAPTSPKPPADDPKPPPDDSGSGGGGSKPSKDGGFGPKGYGINTGSKIASPKNSLVYSDGSKLVLRSSASGKNRQLDFWVKSKISYQGQLEQLKVILEAEIDIGPVELTAYLYNWTTKSWDWIGKKSIGAKKTRIAIERKTPKAYVSGSGEVRVKFYRQSKWWTTFELSADYIRIVPTAKAGSGGGKDPGQKPPAKEPEKKDGSLKDKAKDKWNKWKKKW